MAADLRIFSYIPNPRLAKARIAANFSGATIEVKGDKPRALVDWLWDFDARKLAEEDKESLQSCARTGSVGFAGVTLYKSEAFLKAHPFGSVPAGFSGDGEVGIFESNSIMRAAARLGTKAHGLLGEGPLGESRVDSFLDRTLVYSRDMQRYLLAGNKLTTDQYADMRQSLVAFATGLNTALERSRYIAADVLTLADIAATCELAQLTNERGLQDRLEELGVSPLCSELATFERLGRHLRTLAEEPRISNEIGEYLERLLKTWS